LEEKKKVGIIEEAFMPKRNKIKTDGLARVAHPLSVDLPLARFVTKHKRSSTYYSAQGLTQSFFTDDSKLYFTQEDLEKVRHGESVFHFSHALDSVASRNWRPVTHDYLYWKLAKRRVRRSLQFSLGDSDELYDRLRDRYTSVRGYAADLLSGSVQGMTLSRMWNVTIIGSMIFGMFLMTMIYRYLGQGVMAGGKTTAHSAEIAREVVVNPQNSFVEATNVPPAETEKKKDEDIKTLLTEHQKKVDAARKGENREEKIRQMTKGYPIEKMAPLIAKKDPIVAAFIVSIAKKESNWGKRVPVYKGNDCYNYWGFRAKREKMGTGGHTCFDSPKDAVDSVARRMEKLIYDEKFDTPQKMVSPWKCGYDCSWDKPANVAKWVSDVEMYYSKLQPTATPTKKKK
jgi:hypothetical protein